MIRLQVGGLYASMRTSGSPTSCLQELLSVSAVEYGPFWREPPTTPGMDKSELRFARRVAIVLVMTLLAIALIALITFAFHFVLVVFAGLLLSVLLVGLAGQITNHTPIPHSAAIAIVVLVMLGALTGFGLVIGPQVAEQSTELQERIGEAIETVEEWVAGFGWGAALIEEVPDVQEVLGGAMAELTGLFTTAFAVVFYAVIVLFIGLYTALRPKLYITNFLYLVPKKHRPRAGEVLSSQGRALRYWFLGQFMAMIAVGTLTTIGLMILGVPLALSLGILAGLLEFVPYLGPIFASVPIILVALLEGPEMAIYVGIFFLGIQQLESYVITPIAQQVAVSLPPALLITGQVLFGILGGLVGVILATPLLIALVVAIQLVYVKDVVGDDVEPLGEHGGTD